MKIAVPEWNGNISPVLDTAAHLKVYNVENGVVTETYTLHFEAGIVQRADLIVNSADVLICGAVSRMMEREIASRGVSIHPWIMGNCNDIVLRYIDGSISECEYTMPGCGRANGRRCGRGRYGVCRGNGKGRSRQ